MMRVGEAAGERVARGLRVELETIVRAAVPDAAVSREDDAVTVRGRGIRARLGWIKGLMR